MSILLDVFHNHSLRLVNAWNHALASLEKSMGRSYLTRNCCRKIQHLSGSHLDILSSNAYARMYGNVSRSIYRMELSFLICTVIVPHASMSSLQQYKMGVA